METLQVGHRLIDGGPAPRHHQGLASWSENRVRIGPMAISKDMGGRQDPDLGEPSRHRQTGDDDAELTARDEHRPRTHASAGAACPGPRRTTP